MGTGHFSFDASAFLSRVSAIFLGVFFSRFLGCFCAFGGCFFLYFLFVCFSRVSAIFWVFFSGGGMSKTGNSRSGFGGRWVLKKAYWAVFWGLEGRTRSSSTV